jgi:tetratricopeptide (TPR) repeat protein
VRFKSLAFALFVVIVLSGLASGAPLDCTHLMAWTEAGVPESKLIASARVQGIALSLSTETDKNLTSAGASRELLLQLHRLSPVGTGVCPAGLSRTTLLLHGKKYDDAADVVNQMISKDPANGSLHFLLGYIEQQRGDWDAAFDHYTDSKRLEPGFAEVHNRLALTFYEADDGDNAIGEARTALSMDFDDAGAYRMLGLGHYANHQYPAAINAFQESLNRDPQNADVYYEMAVAVRDQGSVQDAITFLRKAVVLKPQHWQPGASRPHRPRESCRGLLPQGRLQPCHRRVQQIVPGSSRLAAWT